MIAGGCESYVPLNIVCCHRPHPSPTRPPQERVAKALLTTLLSKRPSRASTNKWNKLLPGFDFFTIGLSIHGVLRGLVKDLAPRSLSGPLGRSVPRSSRFLLGELICRISHASGGVEWSSGLIVGGQPRLDSTKMMADPGDDRSIWGSLIEFGAELTIGGF